MQKRIVTLLTLITLLTSSCTSPLPEASQDSYNNIIWAIDPVFDSGQTFSCGLAAVSSNGTTFFINKAGENEWNRSYKQIVTRYQETPGFRYGVAIVKVHEEAEYQYLYRNGIVMDIPYTQTHWSTIGQEQLSLCEDNELYGYMNLQDLWYIQPHYFGGEPFQNGISVAWNEHEHIQHLITESGEKVEVDWQPYISNIGDGFAVANNSYYINTDTGKRTASGPFEDCGEYSEGLAAVMVNGLYGYVDKKGSMLIPPTYMDANAFSCGLAKVLTTENETVFINSDGNIAFSVEEGDDVFNKFYQGALALKHNGRFGLINKTGEWLVRPKYDDIAWSRHGFYRIYRGSKIGIYNCTSDITIEPMYDEIYPITDAEAITKKGEVYGLVNLFTGQVILEPSFLWDGNYGEGLIAIKAPSRGKYGYIDYSGAWIIPPVFESAGRFSEGLAPVKTEGKVGYVANPVYYSKWSPSETRRIVGNGYKLDPHGQLDSITEQEFWTHLVSISQNYKIHIPTAYIKVTNQPLTHGSAAVLCAQFIQLLGDNSACLLSNFSDLDDIKAEEYDNISLAASIGIFELDSAGTFSPDATLNKSTAVEIIVRLCEYLLDTDYRINPQRTNLIVSELW